MPQVVIQRIHSRWSKRSRGGPGARLRNAVPFALTLPILPKTVPFILHTALCSENTDFVPVNTVRSDSKFTELKCRDLEIDLQLDALSIRFYRDGYNAACPSPFPYQDVFLLRSGEWGRIVYNGRYVDFDTGNWWYENSTYNIGLFDTYDADVFRLTEPVSDFRELAALR